MALTTGWFDDKLEWVEKLYDSAYKAHLVNELTSKRESTVASLQKRKDDAQADADNANQELWDNLNAEEDDLATSNADQAKALNDFVDTLTAETAAAGAATNAAFAKGVDDEVAAKNASNDQLEKDWAFWLKYLYGYSGYETSMYADYDDTVDYTKGGRGSDSIAYAGADGAYLDLGY